MLIVTTDVIQGRNIEMLHYLRHTFCTRFCENETNIKVIQAVMGHKNFKTTMDVYAEATGSKKQEAMQNLSAKWKEF